MANGFFNLNAQRPQRNSPKGNIVCRLCNQVFTSYHSLIAHIESHLAQEKNGVNKLDQGNPLLQPNFPNPLLKQETRNFTNNKVLQALPLPPPPPPQAQPPMVMPQPITWKFPYPNNNIQASKPLQLPPRVMPYAGMARFHQGEMDVSPIDGTRPFIDMLDKPIHNNNVPFNLPTMNGDNMLNLTLRL